MNIKSEKGFTLLEMVLVLGIFAVFSMAITALMITTTKMSSQIMKENEAKSTTTLLFPHMERSIREHEAKDAIEVISSLSYDPVLVIDSDSQDANSMKLYYFYEAAEKNIYFQAGTSFQPSNKNKSLKIAENVEELNLILSHANNNLRVKVKINQSGGSHDYSRSIALKAY